MNYQKMNLFDAPKGSVLVHACNTQGVWGKGIAAEFKKRFPEAYYEYHDYCLNDDMIRNDYRGTTLILESKGYIIACLFTSSGYGKNVDSKEDILLHTKPAIREVLMYSLREKKKVFSNQFNSGLFHVPWDETESILKNLLTEYPVEWTVCIQ